ncbi:hypothetical protein BJQ97_01431 [Geobacillus sp. TFV-3]|nr:hypothetical protein BJQ97_01431 [Geobacillus sp. TFV-3]
MSNGGCLPLSLPNSFYFCRRSRSRPSRREWNIIMREMGEREWKNGS